MLSKKRFRWTAGEETLRSFFSSAGFERLFCPRCGTHLVVHEAWNPRGISLAMGTVDGDPDIRPQGHMFVDSMAPWDGITSELPQHRGWPAGLGPAASRQ